MSHVLAEYRSSAAELVYGLDAYGRIVHVSTVPRGAACGCKCPNPLCGIPLIARKGDEKVYHFGHAAGSACGGGPQTALHLFAIQIVKEKKRLVLPAVKASYGDRVRMLYEARLVNFDRAKKEFQELKQIIPDIFVWKSDHQLLIEVAVTHPCDKEKIAKIRAKGIATLEIDLSRVARDASPETIETAVIESAPRRWVFHPSIDAEVSKMHAAAVKKANEASERFKKQVEIYTGEYIAGVKDLDGNRHPQIQDTDELIRAELAEHIGIQIDGYGCFIWSSTSWQSLIWQRFLIPRGLDHQRCHPVEILKYLKEKKAIRPRFGYVAPELEEALAASAIGFLSPYRAIEAYLRHLAGTGVVYKDHNGYLLSSRIAEQIDALRETDQRRETRTNGIISRATRILKALPDGERGSVTAEVWLNDKQSTFGLSFAEAIKTDDDRFHDMSAALRKIERMMFDTGACADNLLELPIVFERNRQCDARQKEENDRKAAKTEAENVARSGRIDRITAAAHRLGDDASAWLNTPAGKFDGCTPLNLAEVNQGGLDRALGELYSETQRREEKKQQAEKIQSFHDQLTYHAERTLGKERGPLFLRSPYKELGRKRPIEHCIDQRTLNECLELLKRVARD
jgi:hypothetical protein